MRFVPVTIIVLLFISFINIKPLLALTCEPVYEMIITLRAPRFGVPTVWDSDFGSEQSLVRFVAGLPDDNGTVLAVGSVTSIDNPRSQEMLLTRINRRGRALMNKRYPLKTNEHIIGIIEIDNSFIIASNFSGTKTERWIRLAWYGKDGKFRRDKIIKDDKKYIEALGIFPATEDNGFILLSQAQDHMDSAEGSEKHAVLTRFTLQGKRLWKRAYRVGIPNAILGLTAIKDRQHYLASGQIMLDDGRMGGWILELNHDGTVVWQRIYGRGANATLRQGVAAGDNYIFMGDATPLDGGEDAAWIMSVSKFGEPLWQRYYRGRNYGFHGSGLMGWPDGRIVLMLNAKATPGSLQSNHIRLLTLSPRGVLMEDEPHMKGMESKAVQLLKGTKQERIIIANAEIPPKLQEEETEKSVDKTEAKKPQKSVMKGWIVVATALDPYEDFCKANERF